MSPRARTAAVALGVLALASVLVPLPVLLHDGWPANHELLASFQRVEGFRRAFSIGDWYPVWSKFAHTGYGSAYPLFYHRLFSTLGGALALVCGSAILAVKLLTPLLLFCGAAGMWRLLRVSGVGPVLSTAGGLLFLVAPYTRTDWIVRGAMAELTAMVLLPWVYSEVSLVLQGRRRWVILAVWMVILFHAHSVIFLFFGLSAAVPLLMHLARERTRLRSDLGQILGAAGILVVGIVPTVIVSMSLLRYFNVAVMTQAPFRIEDNYKPIARYFVDSWQPTSVSDGLSLEINRYVLLGLLVLGVASFKRARQRPPLFLYFLCWSVLCLLLQLPALQPLLSAVPMGKFLQFPFRLISFIALGVIFLFITMANSDAERTRSRATVGVVVLASIVHFGLIRPGTITFFPGHDMETLLTNLDGPRSAGEYQLAGTGTMEFVGSQQQFVVGRGCTEQLRQIERLEQGAFRLEADLPETCRISVRQFYTPILDVELQNATLLSPIPAERILIDLHPGHSAVTIRPRSFWQLLLRVLLGSHKQTSA